MIWYPWKSGIRCIKTGVFLGFWSLKSYFLQYIFTLVNKHKADHPGTTLFDFSLDTSRRPSLSEIWGKPRTKTALHYLFRTIPNGTLVPSETLYFSKFEDTCNAYHIQKLKVSIWQNTRFEYMVSLLHSAQWHWALLFAYSEDVAKVLSIPHCHFPHWFHEVFCIVAQPPDYRPFGISVSSFYEQTIHIYNLPEISVPKASAQWTLTWCFLPVNIHSSSHVQPWTEGPITR